MNIAIITQYYKPEMGAPQNRLYEMAVGLNKLGAKISIITGMPNYPTGRIFKSYQGKLAYTEVIDNITVKRYWLYASNTKKILPRIINMLSFSLSVLFSARYLKNSEFDFLIVESPPLTLGFSGYFLAKYCNTKLVMNISDLWPLSAKELGVLSNKRLYSLLHKIEIFLYKNSELCIGQSQEIIDYISLHGGSKVYLFRNGVDPNRFMRNASYKRNDKLTIVYAGLLGFAQGILDICRNINFKANDMEFHIYGEGGEKEEIESYLKSNAEKGIFFHGVVERDEIPAILKLADVTLVPLVKNIYGAVPSKIYESMAANTPILFSGEGEGKRIIEENNLGWVSPPKDYDALVLNMNQIRLNYNDIIEKRENCEYAARHLYNRPRQIEELYRYLSATISQTKVPDPNIENNTSHSYDSKKYN